MGIRSTSKAIIINNGQILLNKCYDVNNGEYYSLPGGGQNQYETMEASLIRECLEETGYSVKVLRFSALCEEICDDPEIRKNRPDYAHKTHHMFFCELINQNRETPTEFDNFQIASEWIDIQNLSDKIILPKLVGNNIIKIINNEMPVFLGSENIPFNHG